MKKISSRIASIVNYMYFLYIFKRNDTPILLKPFQEEEEGTLHKSLFETSIILVPKLEKNEKKKQVKITIDQYPS